jgi:uncharacterized protein YjbI with pentapeptide repeats
MGNGDEVVPRDEAPAAQPAWTYNQAFFLLLAAKGKDEWNKWRRIPANENTHVTFAVTDFSGAPKDKIDFSGFEFGEGADFSGCTLHGAFTAAIFGDQANFARAQFYDRADFTDATFGDGADFTGAMFRVKTRFDRAHFKGTAAFKFQGGNPPLAISLAHARFDGEANFSSRVFDENADFTGARFYYPPDFDGVKNAGKIDFTGARIRFVPAGKWLHWTTDTQIPVRLRAFRTVAEETKNHDLERDLYIESAKPNAASICIN